MTTPQDAQSEVRGPLPVPAAVARAALPTPAGIPEVAGERVPQPEPQQTIPADLYKRLGFADQTHQYIREYIRLADQKAAFFFSACTALLAFLYRSDIAARWLKPVLSWNVVDAAAFLAMVSLAVAAIVSLVVIIPRTPGSRRGYLFWEAIAEYDTNRQYADDLASLTIPSLLQAKNEHCHDLARVCRRKYRALRIALWVGTVGLGASVLLFLFAGIASRGA